MHVVLERQVSWYAGLSITCDITVTYVTKSKKNVIYKFSDTPFWSTMTSQWLEIQSNAVLQ